MFVDFHLADSFREPVLIRVMSFRVRRRSVVLIFQIDAD